MGIKVATSHDPSRRNKPFPKLMVSRNGEIVYMQRSGAGTQLNALNASTSSGFYTDDWLMSEFVDFDGSITLQNE